MNIKFFIKHAASSIGLSILLAGGAVQSAQAADTGWFLRQLQQTDGNTQTNDAAPVTSSRAIDTHDPVSPAAADKGQMRRRDEMASSSEQRAPERR
jgi:hypothetical protein